MQGKTNPQRLWQLISSGNLRELSRALLTEQELNMPIDTFKTVRDFGDLGELEIVVRYYYHPGSPLSPSWPEGEAPSVELYNCFIPSLNLHCLTDLPDWVQDEIEAAILESILG